THSYSFSLLSLHDALPICFSIFARLGAGLIVISGVIAALVYTDTISDFWSSTWGKLLLAKLAAVAVVALAGYRNWRVITPGIARSEEHTSELQSRENLVCR